MTDSPSPILWRTRTKRNGANGEDNRDGTNDNLSWNCGAEGPTEDAAILARRAADVRALLVTLFAARGTPMVNMGDELGRSQRGNNNAYAQDNELAWINWADADTSLIDFVARLIHVRRAHGALNADTPLTGGPVDATGIPDVEWLTQEGHPLQAKDWNDPQAKILVAVFYDLGDGNAETGGAASSRAAVLINESEEPLACQIPGRRKDNVWSCAINSARPDRAPAPLEAERYELAARSVAILVEQPSRDSRRRATGAPGYVLDSLAKATGIAPHWVDVNGHRHEVPKDTIQALLAALGLPASSIGEARTSLSVLAEERELRSLPVATTLRKSASRTIRLGGPLARLRTPLRRDHHA